MALPEPHTNPEAPTFTARTLLSCALAGLLLLSTCTLPFAGARDAFAEDIDTNPAPDELQQEIERTSAAYFEANAQVDSIKSDIEANEALIAELEISIPAQQERGDAAASDLYKLQQRSGSLIGLLLDSEDFFGFIANLDYLNRIAQSNIEEIGRLNEMRGGLAAVQADLESQQAEAEARAEGAGRALQDAQAARLEAQRRAEEEAQRQAEAEAAARAATAAAADEAAAQGKVANESSDTGSEATGSATAGETDHVDWTQDEVAFVESWTPRIDAYLAGSPLAGQGEAFAVAAWTYGVDPRWSPAISAVESSKGRYCYAGHNAWGWGAVSWDSWEEAIDAHVRGLARGYGYTLTEAAAKKYCPPTWQDWYDKVSAQMNAI